jgi:hypothetical protein
VWFDLNRGFLLKVKNGISVNNSKWISSRYTDLVSFPPFLLSELAVSPKCRNTNSAWAGTTTGVVECDIRQDMMQDRIVTISSNWISLNGEHWPRRVTKNRDSGTVSKSYLVTRRTPAHSPSDRLSRGKCRLNVNWTARELPFIGISVADCFLTNEHVARPYLEPILCTWKRAESMQQGAYSCLIFKSVKFSLNSFHHIRLWWSKHYWQGTKKPKSGAWLALSIVVFGLTCRLVFFATYQFGAHDIRMNRLLIACLGEFNWVSFLSPNLITLSTCRLKGLLCSITFDRTVPSYIDCLFAVCSTFFPFAFMGRLLLLGENVWQRTLGFLLVRWRAVTYRVKKTRWKNNMGYHEMESKRKLNAMSVLTSLDMVPKGSKFKCVILQPRLFRLF